MCRDEIANSLLLNRVTLARRCEKLSSPVRRYRELEQRTMLMKQNKEPQVRLHF